MATRMEFGVSLPQIGSSATRRDLMQVAQAAERFGFESCWSSDHIVVPAAIASRYPYSKDGAFPVRADAPWLDGLGTLLFVAACTERIRLGTSVLVLGYRPPVQTAKLLTTLDTLSEGRAILGVGVGWMREEFDALGMPFDHRGARADEMLEVFETLFTQARPSFDGRFYRFDELLFSPKPVNGRIPIWVGGDAPPALRRAARVADVFHAAFTSRESIAAQWAEVQRLAKEAGRDPASIGLSVRTRLLFDRDPIADGDLHGDEAQVGREVERWAAMGVTQLTLDVGAAGRGTEGQVEAMRRLAEGVRPKLG